MLKIDIKKLKNPKYITLETTSLTSQKGSLKTVNLFDGSLISMKEEPCKAIKKYFLENDTDVIFCNNKSFIDSWNLCCSDKTVDFTQLEFLLSLKIPNLKISNVLDLNKLIKIYVKNKYLSLKPLITSYLGHVNYTKEMYPKYMMEILRMLL